MTLTAYQVEIFKINQSAREYEPEYHWSNFSYGLPLRRASHLYYDYHIIIR